MTRVSGGNLVQKYSKLFNRANFQGYRKFTISYFCMRNFLVLYVNRALDLLAVDDVCVIEED